jgi:hypothetical protein
MSKTFPLFGLFLKVKNLGRDLEFELLTYFKNISEALRFCVLTNNEAELDFYSASSLKQHSAGRHVAPLGHIIPIPSQPVFAFSP